MAKKPQTTLQYELNSNTTHGYISFGHGTFVARSGEPDTIYYMESSDGDTWKAAKFSLTKSQTEKFSIKHHAEYRPGAPMISLQEPEVARIIGLMGNRTKDLYCLVQTTQTLHDKALEGTTCANLYEIAKAAHHNVVDIQLTLPAVMGVTGAAASGVESAYR